MAGRGAPKESRGRAETAEQAVRTAFMMPRGLPWLFVCAVACPSGPPNSSEAHADEPSALARSSSPVIVELFTSEGCSSCPPADALLADLARSNPAIETLEFHIDYWDALGWPDRFSSPDYTARQRSYARSFGVSELYTPQMIVDGADAFAGSNANRARTSITQALGRPPRARVSVRTSASGPGAIAIAYDIVGAPSGATLTLVAIEHSASSAVQAGENSGRMLYHTNVVRALRVVPLAGSRGSATLLVPASLHGALGEVVAYVQSAGDGAGLPVLGATSAPLPM